MMSVSSAFGFLVIPFLLVSQDLLRKTVLNQPILVSWSPNLAILVWFAGFSGGLVFFLSWETRQPTTQMKTLFSWFKCISLGLKLNSAGQSPPGAGSDTPGAEGQ